MQRFEFKCPCCSEIIFSSSHHYERHGILIEGSIITYKDTTIRIRPTEAYILAILLAVYPHDASREQMIEAIGNLNYSRGGHPRVDPDFVTGKTFDVQVHRLRRSISGLKLQINNTNRGYYALEIL